MKKRSLILFCSVLCILLLTACSKKTEITQSPEQNLSPDSAQEITPVQGGSISIYSPKPDSFCPIRTQNPQTISMLNLIFDKLIITSSAMTATPNLADSWSVSDDGLQWNVKLRNDVLWHDNTPFVAADVVYTVNQIRTDSTNYYRKNVEQVSKITAVGQHEVQIQLKTPQTKFINLLCIPIIQNQRGAVDKDSFAVIGTGAFCFEDRGEINSLFLKRNENWWKSSPYLDSILIKMLPDKDTALYSFSSGDIDLIAVDSADLGSKVDTTNAGYLNYSTNKFHFLGFNNAHAVLKNIEVRQAISLAIDREKLVNGILNGNARPAIVPLDTTWELYSSDSVQSLNPDIERAKTVLEEHGWENIDGIYQKKVGSNTVKLQFELLVNNSNITRVQAGAYLANLLRNIGIEVTLKEVSFSDYNRLINNRNYEMFLGAFDIDEDLDYTFMLGNKNIFNYRSDTMNTLLREMQKAVTHTGQKDKYAQFQKTFCEEVPLTGLYFENASMLYNKRMHGSFSPSSDSIYNGLENVFVIH